MLNNIKNIVFGSAKKSILGGIELDIISFKEISREVEISNRRVEKGFIISDTARPQPYTIDIEVIDNSSEFEYNRAELRKLALGVPTTFIYSDGERHDNMVIESLQEQFKQEQSKWGASYKIRLKQIIEARKADEVYKLAPQTQLVKGKVNKVANIKEAAPVEVKEVKKSALLSIFG